MAKARRGICSEIVREIPGAVKHKHRLKRFWRFISNHRIHPPHLFAPWIFWCIRTFCSGVYVPIALDWTTLPGNLPCLMAAVPFHGRAIPLMWSVVPFSSIKDSQNAIEERFITRLISCMPENKRMIIIADRGFGRADLMKFLIEKNLLFVLRIERNVMVTTQEKEVLNLKQLKLTPEIPYWYHRITYRADGAVTSINMAAVVATGSDDPWFLVTNLRNASTTIARYEKRFQIEEWFKDVNHELGLEKMRVRGLKRIQRILFVACTAYGLLMLIGSLANRFTTWKEQLISIQKKACSRIWFALRIIQYELAGSFFWRRVWLHSRAP